ncbi:MAG: MoaD/ThiS family protein [Chloroflexota bacterium]
MAEVTLPQSLVRLFPGAPRCLQADGESVLELIDDLDRRRPGMRNRLLDAGPMIRTHLMIFVDRDRAELSTPIHAQSRVLIVAAVSGG